jgi:NADH:ubiquinone oxidoreductase subunit 5 (subunit L)/multisubunit Na+/H+ antiporter MnhA subunit
MKERSETFLNAHNDMRQPAIGLEKHLENWIRKQPELTSRDRRVAKTKSLTVSCADWFFCELFDASCGFWFDSYTVVMLIVITSISTLVHLYSISYMADDPHIPRAMAYLSIFTFFMLMLVTANNFIQTFLGWEGVGLASYLLINSWFTRL